MASLYADEHMPANLVDALVALGHDVLTAADDGMASRNIDDREVLTRATFLHRAVITFNRWDFHRLHRLNPNHAGIVSCTDDADRSALAERIDAAVRLYSQLHGQLLRVIRPN